MLFPLKTFPDFVVLRILSKNKNVNGTIYFLTFPKIKHGKISPFQTEMGVQLISPGIMSRFNTFKTLADRALSASKTLEFINADKALLTFFKPVEIIVVALSSEAI